MHATAFHPAIIMHPTPSHPCCIHSTHTLPPLLQPCSSHPESTLTSLLLHCSTILASHHCATHTILAAPLQPFSIPAYPSYAAFLHHDSRPLSLYLCFIHPFTLNHLVSLTPTLKNASLPSSSMPHSPLPKPKMVESEKYFFS